jgi:hypothetical protein
VRRELALSPLQAENQRPKMRVMKFDANRYAGGYERPEANLCKARQRLIVKNG